MSAQLQLPRTRYLGIINGIVYRIESNMDGSGRLFEIVPPATTWPGMDEAAAPPQTQSPLAENLQLGLSALLSSEIAVPAAVVIDTETSVADASAPERIAQKEEGAIKGFARDGAEPLRAGHPDLWHLLVAGTCLEGSSFKSAANAEMV